MNKCNLCERSEPQFKIYNDGMCIFHTRTGKAKISEQLVKLEDGAELKKLVIEGKDEDLVKRDFINKFNEFLKNNLGKTYKFNDFIFPAFDDEEWFELWHELKIETIDSKYLNFNNEIIDFKGATFLGEAYFEFARFSGKSYFNSVQFLKTANFNKSQFASGTSFDDAYFSDVAGFEWTHFKGQITFKSTKFGHKVSFGCAKFFKFADFESTKFVGYLTLEQANFFDNVSFHGANFYMSIYSDETCFYKFVDFNSATFWGSILIGDTDFNETVDFEDANFNNYTIFNCRFHDDLNCINTKISDFLSFNGCSFLDVFFNECLIAENGELNISDCDFEKEAELIFDNSKIYGHLRIDNLLNEPIDEANKNIKISMRNIQFFGRGHLIIENIDISGASFWQSNLVLKNLRADFINVEWKTCTEDGYALIVDDWLRFGGEKPNTPLEENKKINELERQYRQLRLAYENRGDYETASMFFPGEMNARKERLKLESEWPDDMFTCAQKKKVMSAKALYWLHCVYGCIAKWGESPQRAIAIILSFYFLIFPLLFSAIGYNQCKTSFFDTMLIFFNILILKTPDSSSVATFNGWGKAIYIFAFICAPVLLTVLGISLRRRFMRSQSK